MDFLFPFFFFFYKNVLHVLLRETDTPTRISFPWLFFKDEHLSTGEFL